MTKIICELGINHFGSIQVSKKLINYAKEANAWGIKFQYRNLEKYFNLAKRNGQIGKEIIDTELKKNYLTPTNIIKLSQYAKKIGLTSGISFFNKDDINDFKKYQFDFYKVPSVSALDFDLIKQLGKFNKKIFISLGSRSHTEILKNKKNLIKNSTKKNTIFFHCISNYPLNPLNSNLNYITKLKNIFRGFRVGYSSHESDIYNCIISLSKNVEYIERHITIDKNSKGLDHSSSSDFIELKKLCFYAKNYNEISNSKKNRYVNQGEKINRQNLGKSAYANKDIDVNKSINIEDISFLSPNISLEKNEISKYLKIKNKKFLNKGDEITIENFCNAKILRDRSKKFCNNKIISLPIRPSDHVTMDNNFQIKNYEFHLSFNDVLKFDIKKINQNFLKNKRLTVHGPDYCDSNNILNIYSKNKYIKKKSLKIFNKCIQICKQLQKYSSSRVFLIQSFSSDDPNLELEKRYKDIKNIITRSYKRNTITILPQWLPPVAWYFGGSSEMTLFCNPDDLKIINRLKIKICLDISHYILSCNYKKINPLLNFNKYKSLFEHYHISDASGIDGEGLEIGNGDLLNYKNFFLSIMNNDKIKVLETWQGHLNNGLIFKKEISKLEKFV